MKTFHSFRAIFAGALALTFTATLHAAPPAGKTPQLTSPDQVPEGLAKSDWQSIRAAYEAGRHAFQPVKGGWQARNPGQQWTTKFDGRGFVAEPRDGDWRWGLELKSYGFSGAERVVGGTPVVKADGQRLTYDWDASVREWFVNDARGLEHGFTVARRPDHDFNTPSLQHSIAPLTFTLATRGTLHPRVAADAQGVAFQDASGATVLTYAGLKVWDADGKVLASRFEAAGENGVRLLVEERGARYPLTIDPIAQQAYLKAHQVNGGDQFGTSVAVSGDTVIVGAWGEDSSTTGVNSTPDESAPNAGAAYVFVRSGTDWTQQAYLKAHQISGNDNFGLSVAVSGGTVVVGANREASSTTGINSTPDEGAGNAGAAYIFTGPPEIAVEQPEGTDLTAGTASLGYGAQPVSTSSAAKVFTVRNLGLLDLTLSAPAATGGNAGDFIADTTGTLLVLAPGQTTTFSVPFIPVASGARATTLRIINDDADKNPFDIALTGTGLSSTDDTDSDGLNDVAEFNLSALGFDWQVSQTELVSILSSGANSAGLYTASQVQAMHVSTPLISRNATTGLFKLTFGLKKSTTLESGSFNPFAFTSEGTVINGSGQIEFEFASPDNAAFFILGTE